jgi:hypothetical protein
MDTKADDEGNSHISEKRLVEVAKGTVASFSNAEKIHLAVCDRCVRVLTALLRLQRGDY